MKKIIYLVLVISMVISSSFTTLATERELSFSEKLLSAKINTVEEFEHVLRQYSADNKNSNSKKTFVFGDSDEIKLNDQLKVFYDEKNKIVTLLNNKHNVSSTNSSKGSSYSKEVTVDANAYSDVGMKIFTVTLECKWEYDKSSYVKNIYKRGFFSPTIISLWDSSPWTEVYPDDDECVAECYGTALMDIGIAESIGIEINLGKLRYVLNQTCDKYGYVDVDWSLENVN